MSLKQTKTLGFLSLALALSSLLGTALSGGGRPSNPPATGNLWSQLDYSDIPTIDGKYPDRLYRMDIAGSLARTGRYLVVGDEKGIAIFDGPTAKLLRRVDGIENPVTDQDEKLYGVKDDDVYTIDPATGAIKQVTSGKYFGGYKQAYETRLSYGRPGYKRTLDKPFLYEMAVRGDYIVARQTEFPTEQIGKVNERRGCNYIFVYSMRQKKILWRKGAGDGASCHGKLFLFSVWGALRNTIYLNNDMSVDFVDIENGERVVIDSQQREKEVNYLLAIDDKPLCKEIDGENIDCSDKNSRTRYVKQEVFLPNDRNRGINLLFVYTKESK